MPKPRLPDATKQLHGETRSERFHGEKPTYGKRKPTAPRSLRDDARPYWDEYAATLYAAGILEDVDRHALATLCELEVDEDDAYTAIAENGRYYQGPNNAWAMHPAAKELLRIQAQKRMYYSQFGLTPQAREKLTIEQDDEPTPEEIHAQNILGGNFGG